MQERERRGVATYLNGTRIWMPAGGLVREGKMPTSASFRFWVLIILIRILA